MYELMIESSFSAAHQLVGSNGPCESLHGHTWKVQVFFEGGTLDNIGMLTDFKVLKKQLAGVLARYDHSFLNDALSFSPTAENIARHIHDELSRQNDMITKVSVWESPTARASYWK